jgi:L-fuconolactonase
VQIDTHTHVVAADAGAYPLTPLDAEGGWYRTVANTVEDMVGALDEGAVDAAVLVQAVSAYRYDNRYVVDSAARFPARCASVVCLDPASPDTPAELARLTRDHGARGLRWWALGNEPLDVPAVWSELARLGTPVVVTMFASRIGELGDLVPRLPPVPIALDHCAFADFARGVPDDLRSLAEHPAVHPKVSTIVLDRMSEHGDVRDALAELAACFGAERLMWGSDYSQTHDRGYADLAEYARAASSRLAEDDRSAFLGGTAARLWPGIAR